MKIDHSQHSFDNSRYSLIINLKRYLVIGYKNDEWVCETVFRNIFLARAWFMFNPDINFYKCEVCIGNGKIIEKWMLLVDGTWKKVNWRSR